MVFQLPREGKEKVALAIYHSKPSLEEIKLGKKPAFLTSTDMNEPFFVYASGRIGPYYIDLRNVPSFPNHCKSILTQLFWYLDTAFGSENINFIVSTESAGISWGQSAANYFGVPFCYARKEPKDRGTKKLIEGFISKGQAGLDVDDTVTTLKTLKNAVDGVQAEGGRILACLPIFDRKQYTDKELIDLGAPVYPLIGVFDFADIGIKTGNLSKDNARLIKQYHEDEAAYALDAIKNNTKFITTHPELAEKILAGYAEEYSKTNNRREKKAYGLVIETLKEILGKPKLLQRKDD
jgi:orotate phosphoribosyltransferase